MKRNEIQNTFVRESIRERKKKKKQTIRFKKCTSSWFVRGERSGVFVVLKFVHKTMEREKKNRLKSNVCGTHAKYFRCGVFFFLWER